MNSEKLLKSMLLAAVASLLAACGGTDPEDSNGPSGSGPLLPLSVGNSWEYRVVDKDGVITQKRTTVMDQEPVGGTGPYAALMAFKVVTRKGPDLNTETGLDKTESWQAPDPEEPARIVRYRELSYGAMTTLLQLEEFWDPPRIHIDGSAAHTANGVMWIETYTENKLPVGDAATVSEESDLWSVVSGDAVIAVPKGSFDHSVHTKKTAATGGGDSKDYWYQRGVGKIKESGPNQTEELVDYNVSGAAQ